jgi:hypothetical protein
MEQLMIKKCLATLLLAGLFVGPANLCRAQVFAEVKSIVSTTNPTKVNYFWDNPTATFGTVPAPTPIVFAFDVLGTPSGLSDVNATMPITANAPNGNPAFNYNPITKTQLLGNLTFTINAVGGMGYAPGQLLLMGTFQVPGIPDAALSQDVGGTANLQASRFPVTPGSLPGGLTLFSPFFAIDNTKAQKASWSFSTLVPDTFTNSTNGVRLDSIPLINGNGNFSATVVPEPGVLPTLLGAGIVGGIFIRRRRRA